jgi:hypothetical protein
MNDWCGGGQQPKFSRYLLNKNHVKNSLGYTEIGKDKLL